MESNTNLKNTKNFASLKSNIMNSSKRFLNYKHLKKKTQKKTSREKLKKKRYYLLSEKL